MLSCEYDYSASGSEYKAFSRHFNAILTSFQRRFTLIHAVWATGDGRDGMRHGGWFLRHDGRAMPRLRQFGQVEWRLQRGGGRHFLRLLYVMGQCRMGQLYNRQL